MKRKPSCKGNGQSYEPNFLFLLRRRVRRPPQTGLQQSDWANCVGLSVYFLLTHTPLVLCHCLAFSRHFRMANSSPVMPSSASLSQRFFPPGGSSPPGCLETQHATPVSLPAVYTQCFPAVDTGLPQGPSGTNMSVMPPAPAGVSFIIQIGLTRESVLLPQTADITYVKQIACSIVDQKVSSKYAIFFIHNLTFTRPF